MNIHPLYYVLGRPSEEELSVLTADTTDDSAPEREYISFQESYDRFAGASGESDYGYGQRPTASMVQTPDGYPGHGQFPPSCTEIHCMSSGNSSNYQPSCVHCKSCEEGNEKLLIYFDSMDQSDSPKRPRLEAAPACVRVNYTCDAHRENSGDNKHIPYPSTNSVGIQTESCDCSCPYCPMHSCVPHYEDISEETESTEEQSLAPQKQESEMTTATRCPIVTSIPSTQTGSNGALDPELKIQGLLIGYFEDFQQFCAGVTQNAVQVRENRFLDAFKSMCCQGSKHQERVTFPIPKNLLNIESNPNIQMMNIVDECLSEPADVLTTTISVCKGKVDRNGYFLYFVSDLLWKTLLRECPDISKFMPELDCLLDQKCLYRRFKYESMQTYQEIFKMYIVIGMQLHQIYLDLVHLDELYAINNCFYSFDAHQFREDPVIWEVYRKYADLKFAFRMGTLLTLFPTRNGLQIYDYLCYIYFCHAPGPSDRQYLAAVLVGNRDYQQVQSGLEYAYSSIILRVASVEQRYGFLGRRYKKLEQITDLFPMRLTLESQEMSNGRYLLLQDPTMYAVSRMNSMFDNSGTLKHKIISALSRIRAGEEGVIARVPTLRSDSVHHMRVRAIDFIKSV